MDRFGGSLSAPLPAGWFAKESITLMGPDGQGNVICSSEPLSSDIDTGRYAQVQGDLLRREFPWFVEHSLTEIVVFGDCLARLRHFQWTPPDGVPVTQLQLYYAENGRGYTATATSPSNTFSQYEPHFRAILEGLARQGAAGRRRESWDWMVSEVPRPNPRMRDAVVVGEERVRGADGGFGQVKIYATPTSYEECVAQLMADNGGPTELGTEKTVWRSETVEGATKVASWVTVFRGSSAAGEPGFDQSRVPAGTAAIVSYGRYEGPGAFTK